MAPSHVRQSYSFIEWVLKYEHFLLHKRLFWGNITYFYSTSNRSFSDKCKSLQTLHKEIVRHKVTVDEVVATGIQIIYEGKPESVSVRGKLTGIFILLWRLRRPWRRRDVVLTWTLRTVVQWKQTVGFCLDFVYAWLVAELSCFMFYVQCILQHCLLHASRYVLWTSFTNMDVASVQHCWWSFTCMIGITSVLALSRCSELLWLTYMYCWQTCAELSCFGKK